VAAVGFDASLARAPDRPRPAARLVLADGSRLTLADARPTLAGAVRGQTVFGATIEVPLTAVVALAPPQPRVVYLSDLPIAREVHDPYLDVRRPAVRDGSAAGRWLRLGGDVYDKGLGVHSRSELTYALDGRYEMFAALVGLDDHSGRRGSVRVRVEVDGVAHYRSPELTAGGPPVAVRVDVYGARRLTLHVEYGRGGNVGDDLNWAEALLVRRRAASESGP
jgi:hypothetical protein